MISRFLMVLVTLVFLSACGPQAEPFSARRDRVLFDLSRNVAVHEVEALAASAKEYADLFLGDHDVETRRKAIDAWRALRVQWKRVAPWIIATAAEDLYEERLDAEADFEGLEEIREGGQVFLADEVAKMGWPKKSLSAQGVLLFSPGPLPLRAWSLLEHAASEWHGEAHALARAWSQRNGLKDALARPRSGQAFKDSKDAVDVLLRRCVLIVARLRDDDLAALVKETRKGKLARFEAHFDRPCHHREDLIATLSGIESVYLGLYDKKERGGLSLLVKEKNPRIDEAFRAALASAQSAANELPSDLVRAAENDPALARDLYDYVTLMKAQLATSIASLLETSLGFTLADGD